MYLNYTLLELHKFQKVKATCDITITYYYIANVCVCV